MLLPAILLMVFGTVSVALSGVPKPFHMVSLVAAVLALAIAAQHATTRPALPYTLNGVTVHSSEQSVTGRVVVEDVQLPQHTMRVLRADHSLVGGRWLQDGELGDS